MNVLFLDKSYSQTLTEFCLSECAASQPVHVIQVPYMCTRSSTGTTVLLVVGLRDRYRVLDLVRGLLVVPELRYRHYMYYCTYMYSRFSYFYNHFVHYHRYMSTGTVHVSLNMSTANDSE